MRVTVCELPEAPSALEDAWADLVRHAREEASDLVLRPEMPFHPWLPRHRDVDPGRWEEAARAHRRWADRLAELEPAAVVSGAYGLSSNRAPAGRRLGTPGAAPVSGGGDAPDAPEAFDWARQGWAVDPDEEVMGLTSPESPFLTVEIDRAAAEAARETYPRYVEA